MLKQKEQRKALFGLIILFVVHTALMWVDTRAWKNDHIKAKDIAVSILPEVLGALIIYAFVSALLGKRRKAEYLNAIATFRVWARDRRVSGHLGAKDVQDLMKLLVPEISLGTFGSQIPQSDPAPEWENRTCECDTCGNKACMVKRGACIDCKDIRQAWQKDKAPVERRPD